jgi:hypothetical protein
MIDEMCLCAGELGESALLTALLAETSSPVRHKIVARLAMVGGEDALAVLAELAEPDRDLAAHAAFAASVIAHRAGIAGYEPAPVDEADLLPAPVGAPAAHLLETYDTIPDLSGGDYGLILGPNVAGLRCAGRRLAVAIDLTALARLLTTPAVAGLITEADGSPQTSMLILCSPVGDNTARVTVHHTAGVLAFVGTARVSGTTVTFRLTAVRSVGGRGATLTGTIKSGVLHEVTLRAP